MRAPVADASPVATPAAAPSGRRALTAAEAMWVAAVSVAAVAVLAIAVLGAPLGRALLPGAPADAWPAWAGAFNPEPEELGRYLLALAAPLMLVALGAALVQSRLRARPAAIGAAVTAIQLAGAGLVLVCIVEQRDFAYGAIYSLSPEVTFHQGFFSPATLVVAALVAGLLALGMRSARVRRQTQRLTRETTASRWLAGALAVAAVAVWLLHAFNTEETILLASTNVWFHLQYPLDETFAVIDGRSPLVDMATQYGSLLPYAFAAGMSVAGRSVGGFVTLALLLTGGSMLAIYGALRRVVRSSLAALALFLPFLATSFFIVDGTLENRYTYANYFGTFPIRYAGPFLLAWLVARHVARPAARTSWPIFLLAGLVAINNVDAGIPALGATAAALLVAHGRPTRATLSGLARAAGIGLASAVALVCLLTLVRAGSLPSPGLLFRYSELFSRGFGLMPTPTLGLHVVLYLTFVAAIGVAATRTLGAPAHQDGRDRALTALLAWSGVFGLGAGTYYVSRSHPENLVATFPIWALALVLLLVVCIHSLAARPSRVPTIAELACMLGFGVAVCSLAQTPTPWGQLERLGRTTDPGLAMPAERAYVEQHTDDGEPVLILVALGHRLAADAGVENVSSYTGVMSMPLRRQLDESIGRLRDAGGSKVFLPAGLPMVPDLQQGLVGAGFSLRDRQETLELWADRP